MLRVARRAGTARGIDRHFCRLRSPTRRCDPAAGRGFHPGDQRDHEVLINCELPARSRSGYLGGVDPPPVPLIPGHGAAVYVAGISNVLGSAATHWIAVTSA